MAIPQSFIQELLSRIDIVEVVGRYVQLKKGGANFMGLCPFHSEKSPSFSVSPAKQFFHCFGCGKHGHAIGFLMEHTGAGFVEAVHDLAQQIGLQVPEEDLTPQQRELAAAQRQRQTTLNEVLMKAAHAYQGQLRQAPRAVDYLKRRGLSGEVAKTFGLGHAPEGWRFLSTVFPDYQSPLLVESGLVIAADDTDASDAPKTGKRYDRFRDRIMFPIRNVKGECIGFGGRVLDQGDPKYLNSPETPVFSKGRELYGLFEARSAIRQAGYVLVTEGYMDVVALAQWGFAQAVATLGTACTPDHIRLLLRFSDHVVFSFDGDAAGRRAARKALDAALPWATDTRSFKFLFLPPEHDPDSFVRSQGAAAFTTAIEQATPLSRFLLDAAASGCDLDTAEGRARMASQAQPLFDALPDATLKRQLLLELADGVGLDARDLLQSWQAQSRRLAPSRSAGHVAERSLPLPTEAAAPPTATLGPAATPKTAPLPRRRSGKRGLLGRADRVARIVLNHPNAWECLTDEDHHLLAHQPQPHGPLFAWLERLWLEHGPLPWAALSVALQGQPFAALAQDLHTSGLALECAEHQARTPKPAAPAASADWPRELRQLLRRMHIERLKQVETELVAQATQDPEALRRYRSTQAQRMALENTDAKEVLAQGFEKGIEST